MGRVGAALTVTYAILTGDESVSVGKVVFIAGIIAAVVGLKLVPSRPGRAAERAPDPVADASARSAQAPAGTARHRL